MVGEFVPGRAPDFEASGFGDLAAQTRLTPNSRFYAASISKQFTALAIAKLAEAGRLSPRDEIGHWLPELSSSARGVTIDMLLHHTSGLPDWMGVVELSGGTADAATRAQVLSVMARQRPMFEPGAAFRYSNGGYFLLAEIVARASGVPFATYLSTAVFTPLGMTDSGFIDGAAPRDAVHGYVKTHDGFAVRDTYPRISGSGGLVTSVADLARYDADIAGGHRVWTPFVDRLLMTPGRLRDGGVVTNPYSGLAYAGGLEVGVADGMNVVAHEGVADGFRNYYVRYTDLGLDIAVFCNRGDADPQARARTVIERLHPDALHPARAADFFSDTLGARYRLVRADHSITASLAAPLQGRQTRPTGFDEQVDGAYLAPNGDRIVLDPDGKGFVLDAGLAGRHRFEAVAK